MSSNNVITNLSNSISHVAQCMNCDRVMISNEAVKLFVRRMSLKRISLNQVACETYVKQNIMIN